MENKKRKTLLITIIILVGLAMLGYGAYLGYTSYSKKDFLKAIIGLVLAVVGLVLDLYIILTYNKFVRYKNKVSESLSLVDIQLKQRFDLIPNLVNTVKGYAKHEKEVLAEITELRNKAVATNEEKEKIELGNQMLPKLRQILMIAEDYPELKADKLYRSLMEELVLIEDKIVAARRFYDSNVNLYNTSIEGWPGNIIANLFAFTKVELYRIDAGERLNIDIDFKN